MSHPFYIQVMKRELERRIATNPRYSLRAYAKALSLDPGTLSRTLACKRRVTMPSAVRIARALGLEPESRRRFLESVADVARETLIEELEDEETAAAFDEVDDELFRVMSDWHHYAILELTFLEGFRSDPRWIAAALGITMMEAKLAVDRLLDLGLLRRSGDTLIKTKKTIRSGSASVSSPAVREHQKQTMEMSITALENIPVEQRVSVSMTMPIEAAKLDLARQLIQDFSLEVCRKLACGSMDAVYQLNVALFPLTKRET